MVVPVQEIHQYQMEDLVVPVVVVVLIIQDLV